MKRRSFLVAPAHVGVLLAAGRLAPSEPVVLADEVCAKLDRIREWMNRHEHCTAPGPSSPPIRSMIAIDTTQPGDPVSEVAYAEFTAGPQPGVPSNSRTVRACRLRPGGDS